MVQPLIASLATPSVCVRKPNPSRYYGRRFVRFCLRTMCRASGDRVLFAAVLLAGLIVSFVTRAHRHDVITTPTTTPLTIRVTVGPGDSLWSLSRRYSNPDSYIEENVDAMAKANGMDSQSRLVVGQRLQVAVTNPVELASLQTHVASAR